MELKKSYQVVIVGGGPVGLFLGCCLQKLGISFIILEKRKERISHSRSLGIHPVSLELFEALGFVRNFIEKGIKIKRGLAFTGTGKIGSIDFHSCPKPFNFILSLPQYKTEKILEKKLIGSNPDALLRGTKVINIQEESNHVFIESKNLQTDSTYNLRCQFLVGCDGKESIVRKQAGISFKGSSYPDTYIMGDFTDNTDFGNNAAVFLAKEGLIESFPISDNQRRWVVKTASYIRQASRKDIEKAVGDRIGHDLSEQENFMISSFGVQKLMAESFAKNRAALAGDAAHIVSPIGGQGMNLGWLDAWELSKTLNACLKNPEAGHEAILKNYSKERIRVTKNAIKRGELNMRLGRKTAFPQFRNAVVWMMLNTPLQKIMVRMFTMRNLDGRFI